MKGIILAGGNGRRLSPLTDVSNKHLLPLYDKQVIFFPLNTLLKAGLTEILIVLGPDYAGSFLKLLGSGRKYGCNINYEVQDEAGGIAQALNLAKDYVRGESCAVILGDNIFEDQFDQDILEFKKEEKGAKIFLKKVADPHRFGVAEVDGEDAGAGAPSSESGDSDGGNSPFGRGGRVVLSLEEKPKNPKSDLAVTGFYLYDSSVFDKIAQLKPSIRGELEVTDLNNVYLQEGNLKSRVIQGDWSDVGTFESLHRASTIARDIFLKGHIS